MSKIAEFFAAGGPLSQQFAKYESRAEQAAMAQAVADAAAASTNVLVEAGTGVGKSIAYLAPVIQIIEGNRTVREKVSDMDDREVERPRRLVVSTGTIALQKQLFDKELPMMKKLYPWLTYAMAVGSENYLCSARLKKAIGDVASNPMLLEDAGDLEAIEKWSRTTTTGLRMDLDKPVSHSAWAAVNRQADLCRCREWDPNTPCFYRKAKNETRAANVVLVNHHLLMAHLTSEFGGVLPNYDCLVVDEIHALEDVATQCFGVDVSNYKITRLIKDANRAVKAAGEDLVRADEISEIFETVGRAADTMFDILRQRIEYEKKDVVRLRQPLVSGSQLDQVQLIEQLNRVSNIMKASADDVADPQKSHEIRALAKRAADASGQIRTWLLQSESDHVFQIASENGGKRIVAKSNPVDVSKYLKACLWDQKYPVIGTSATISTSGTMKFVKGKLGADEAAELVLASPFDYVSNALLYVAADLPESKPGLDPAYFNAMVERIIDLLKVSKGRALVLCTSNQTMKTIGARIRPALPDLNVMVQGEDIERHTMVEILKRNPNSVIVATASFWQGIDIAGDALQMVIITKLPFPQIGDPLFEAKCERIDLAGGPGTKVPFHKSSFMKLSLPECIIKLKQGYGRLIRTATDWGCVAILDTRIITKKYGTTVIGSLPRTYIKYQVKDVAEFFDCRTPVPESVAPAAEESVLDEAPF